MMESHKPRQAEQYKEFLAERAPDDARYMQELVLKQKHGIDPVRDDRTEWNPPRPPYRVYLLLNEVRYEIEAHHLVDIGGGRSFTVVLRPC